MVFLRQIILLALLLGTSVLNATVYTTIADGDWNDNASWDANGKPGTFWGAADQVVINHDVTLNQNFGFAGTLTISGTGSLIGSRNVTLNNGAVITANGEVSIKKLTLNSSSDGTFSDELTISNNLTVGSGSTLITNDTVQVSGKLDNNGGTITGNSLFEIGGNLTNNNGSITFNERTTVGGKFDNNNSSAEITINDDFIVTGNITNNSSATINVNGTGNMETGGNLTNNSGSEINNSGDIDVSGNFANNGGTVNNDNVFWVDGNFTQNGGTFTNDGVLVVESNFTVNGTGTVNGSGLIRTDSITNFGTISGSNDICRLDDTTPSSQSGGGSYSGSTSYCTESASAALPITLVYFRGNSTDYGFRFEWQTASEINNDYFEIQYAPSAENFYTVAEIKGAGNSSKTLNYKKDVSFINADKSGYFRLKQTDFDGTFSYSKVIYLKRSVTEKALFKVYPNPSKGNEIYLKLSSSDQPIDQIQLLDITGKIIISKRIINSENSTFSVELLDGRTLKAGIYFIRTNGIESQIKKIIVQ